MDALMDKPLQDVGSLELLHIGPVGGLIMVWWWRLLSSYEMSGEGGGREREGRREEEKNMLAKMSAGTGEKR